MSESYSVKIANDNLVFSAAHFITFEGLCERLHGHNYRVAVEVRGPLDENHYVVDFTKLLALAIAIVGELDHRVLVPTEHAEIHVQADDLQVELGWNDRRWSFPRQDCVLLPMANTTAERLAQYIGRRLAGELAEGSSPDEIRVEVQECFGQSAACTIVAD